MVSPGLHRLIKAVSGKNPSSTACRFILNDAFFPPAVVSGQPKPGAGSSYCRCDGGFDGLRAAVICWAAPIFFPFAFAAQESDGFIIPICYRWSIGFGWIFLPDARWRPAGGGGWLFTQRGLAPALVKVSSCRGNQGTDGQATPGL